MPLSPTAVGSGVATLRRRRASLCIVTGVASKTRLTMMDRNLPADNPLGMVLLQSWGSRKIDVK